MSLLDVLVPVASADAVAVFSQDSFLQVFPRARPLKCDVTRAKKLMDHPIETGAVITDHQVITPIEIEISTICQSRDFRSTYKQIEQLFLAGTLLTVQTKASTFRDMIISDMPHDEDADLYDALSVAIKLREADFVTAQYGTLPQSKVANKNQSSTIDRGEQQGKAAAPKASILYRVFH